MKRKNIILVIIITISMILLSSFLFMVMSNHYKSLNNNADTEIKEENNSSNESKEEENDNQSDENLKEEDNNIENNQDNNDNNNESNNSELTTYKVELENYYMETNEQIKFYSNQQLVNEYKCNGKQCYVEPFITKCVYENGKSDCKNILGDYVLIAVNDKYDGTSIDTYGGIYFQKINESKGTKSSGNVFLYNIKTGESKKYENVYKIMSAHKELRLIEYTDGSYTIISNDGKINSKFSKDGLVLHCYEGCYLDLSSHNYKDNMIVTIKDKKYGLEKITNNNIIVKHQFDEIKLSDSGTFYDNEKEQDNYMLYQNKYIKVKENGKWYLYDLKNNKKVNNTGYDKFYLIDENTMIVMEDKYFYIKDYDNNLLTSEKIYIENLFPSWPKITEGIRIEKNGDNCTITIVDGTGVGYQKYYYYSYNLKSKELKKVTGE